MSSDKEKEEGSSLAKIKVLIPFVVSVLSLAFGVYQYIDKRKLMQLQIQETKQKNQSFITIHYLEAELESIRNVMRHGLSFDEACLRFLSDLEDSLPFATKLTVLENIIYKEIKEYENGIQDHYVSFFLIRNSGGCKAVSISTEFVRKLNDGESSDYPILIDEIDPGACVMFAIDHFNMKTGEHFGTVLSQKYLLEYFDVFLSEKKQIDIRPRLASPRIISPKIRLRE